MVKRFPRFPRHLKNIRDGSQFTYANGVYNRVGKTPKGNKVLCIQVAHVHNGEIVPVVSKVRRLFDYFLEVGPAPKKGSADAGTN